MSWQGYVDNLMGTKNLTHVGIFGLDGAPWATSPSFPVCMLAWRTQGSIAATSLECTVNNEMTTDPGFSWPARRRRNQTNDWCLGRLVQSGERPLCKRREIHSSSKRPRPHAHHEEGPEWSGDLQVVPVYVDAFLHLSNQDESSARPFASNSALIDVTNLQLIVFKGVIIALHDQTVKSEIAVTSVGKVIDYLGKHGY